VHIGISGELEHARWLDNNASLWKSYHPELSDHDHSHSDSESQWRLIISEKGEIDLHHDNGLSFFCAKPSLCSDSNGKCHVYILLYIISF